MSSKKKTGESNQRPGPRGGIRDRNRKKKTKQLENAALTLFLKSGIANVTVEEIASQAKMAKGSFYRYAKSKTDLVTRLVAPLRDGVESAYVTSRIALKDAKSSGLALIYFRLATHLGELVDRYPRLVRLYLQESRAPKSRERVAIIKLATIIRSGSDELTELAAKQNLLGDIAPWLSATVVVGAVEELLFAQLTGRSDRDPAVIQRGLIEMVLYGISRRHDSHQGTRLPFEPGNNLLKS